MEIDGVSLHVMWRETDSYLDLLADRVQEGKDLGHASNFCRYIFWSGLVTLFKRHANTGPLKVDGALLDWKRKEIERQIGERYKGGVVPATVNLSALESIHRKLDLIAGRVAQMPIAAPVAAAVPVLQVLEGGVNERSA